MRCIVFQLVQINMLFCSQDTCSSFTPINIYISACLCADLTGAQDGSVRMFEWGHSQQITCFRSPGNSRVTRIRFNYQGNKVRQPKARLQTERERAARVNQLFCVCLQFGIVDADGALSLWQTSTSGNTPKPYLVRLLISPASDVIL